MSTMTSVAAWNGTEPQLYWIKFAHKDSGGSAANYYWAPVGLSDPSTYQGGFKEARTVMFDRVEQALSTSTGRLRINSCAFTLSDLPWSTTTKEPSSSGSMVLRGFLGDTDTLGIIDAEVSIYLVTDTDRRASTAPLRVFHGVVTGYEGIDPYQFRFECEDIFGAHPLRPITLPVTNVTDFPSIVSHFGATSVVMGQKIGIPYGELTSTVGKILCRPVGPFTALDASTWYGYAIAACAIKELTAAWYVDGGVVNAITFDDVTWTGPGSAGFAALFGPVYYDAPSGQRYTLLYTSDSGLSGVTVTANVKGVEAQGDGSSVLISSIYGIMGHVFDNFAGTDTPYAGGDWAAIPQWSDGTNRRDDASFNTVTTAAAAAIPAGPDCAIWIFQDEDAENLLAQLALCGDCDQAVNLDGQYSIYIDSPGSPTSALTESDHILEGSFRFSGKKADLVNAGSVNYAPRYIGEDAASLDASVVFVTAPPSLTLTASVSDSDATSIANHGTVNADAVDLIAVSDATQAAQILARRIARTAEPRLVNLDVGLHHLLADGLTSGSTITVTHRQGASQNGWTVKSLYVRGMSIGLNEQMVSLECADLEAASP